MTDRLFSECCYGTDLQHAEGSPCPQTMVPRETRLEASLREVLNLFWGDGATKLAEPFEVIEAAVKRAESALAVEGPQPGTFEYALDYHEKMTAKQPNETPAEKARREYYAGIDDDGLPCD